MMGKANKRKKLLTMLQNKVRKGGMAGLMGAKIKKKEIDYQPVNPVKTGEEQEKYKHYERK